MKFKIGHLILDSSPITISDYYQLIDDITEEKYKIIFNDLDDSMEIYFFSLQVMDNDSILITDIFRI